MMAAIYPLLVLFISSVGAEIHHIQVGSNIFICGLGCQNSSDVLDLKCCPSVYILNITCSDNQISVHDTYRSRLDLNASSGCGVLRDAQKNDSCVYEVSLNSRPRRVLSTIRVIVIDTNSKDILPNSDRKNKDGLAFGIISGVLLIGVIIFCVILFMRINKAESAEEQSQNEICIQEPEGETLTNLSPTHISSNSILSRPEKHSILSPQVENSILAQPETNSMFLLRT
ncbi:uncharacterized protein LOC128645774 [Bombina bombina]|uniref:uncharacterized protein LOC128645774 n=1 Tax=Bombina bombina TaxID=8345 RepID=UPI00235A8D78|nr:uncharacterized protein LOC128645774 [Bombina bombina]